MNKKQKQSFAIVFIVAVALSLLSMLLSHCACFTASLLTYIAGLALLIGWGFREDRRISREDHADREQ